MHGQELIGLILFLSFWLMVYRIEAGYLFRWIRRRGFTVRGRAGLVHALAVLGLLCLAYGYFIEPYWLDVRHVYIQSPKIKGRSIVIAQISDLHCDPRARLEHSLVERVNALHPDLVLFTGDALNSPAAQGLFHQTLAGLRAQTAKFAVRGNFEAWVRDGGQLLAGTGFRELDGQAVALEIAGTPLTVAGVSVAHDCRRDRAFLDALDPDRFNIFLYHYPGIHEDLGDLPVDLYLAGHTHGGQIALPLYGAIVTMSSFGKKYEAGRYDLGGGRILYVNRGIGMEGGIAPRVRFWSRPEVTVFHLVPMSETLSTVDTPRAGVL